MLQPGLNASSAVLLQLLQGSEDTQECYWLGAVHVKDVARAQILLFETPAASGRYLCTNGIYQFGAFTAKVAKLFPEYPIHRYLSTPLGSYGFKCLHFFSFVLHLGTIISYFVNILCPKLLKIANVLSCCVLYIWESVGYVLLL